jgi:hypothetical protein
MSDMDREGQRHASRWAASEGLSLMQLEATFQAVLAEALASATRLNELEQTWSQKKRPSLVRDRESLAASLASGAGDRHGPSPPSL